MESNTPETSSLDGVGEAVLNFAAKKGAFSDQIEMEVDDATQTVLGLTQPLGEFLQSVQLRQDFIGRASRKAEKETPHADFVEEFQFCRVLRSANQADRNLPPPCLRGQFTQFGEARGEGPIVAVQGHPLVPIAQRWSVCAPFPPTRMGGWGR